MKLHPAGATKRRVIEGLRRIARATPDAITIVAGELFAEDAAYISAHPVNQMHGLAEIAHRYLVPLKHAMPDLERRDDIVMSGHWQDGDWVSATGYYYGTLQHELFGFRPNNAWVYLRYGEFYKLIDGRIVDAYAILDWVDFFRQLGINPLRRALGVEGLCPPPMAQDGLQLYDCDPNEGEASLKLVEAMIFEGMWAFDGVNHETMRFHDFWVEDMMWYGPGGIGTTRGVENFYRYHEGPFNEAWPDFKGGNHVARFGDGPYTCSTGWPSIKATHSGGNFLGLAPSNQAITMRVMDWWRRNDDRLAENWIFIDLPELFDQLGRDLFAEARALQPAVFA
ncbi:ester cyclase [Novosphingobium sp. Gsoil 351]|uniref:ester cyclase n=1 Tax=Novosphingobium sp. Gsoil 351 TaxID=2675225 RepID=UPI0012B4A6FE|nr:ester cyclase [Novosphingobium sp. Gsoil 351]QGN55803.1 polyketide cyclase [Novosphingobium sp. Gsoil 351]